VLNEPLTNARMPENSDAPSGGAQITAAVKDLASFTLPRFTTTSARNTAYTQWVTEGGTMVDGLHCAVDGETQVYRDGGWWRLAPADIDSRIFPSGDRAYVDLYLRRSDGVNVINASTWSNPSYGAGFTDLKVYPVGGASSGTWNTSYNGRGVSNSLPGWYRLEAALATAHTGGRYVELQSDGTGGRLNLGVDTMSQNGFGLARGGWPVRAPAGLNLVFLAYNSVDAEIPLRTTTGQGGTTGDPLSKVRIVYEGPI
jgi:hypothetical protein